jgi:hypothetical protein
MGKKRKKTNEEKETKTQATTPHDEHEYEPKDGIGLKRIVRVHMMSRWKKDAAKKRRPVQGIGAMYPRLNG